MTGSSNQRMSASAQAVGKSQRLLHRERAIGIDEQFMVADGRPWPSMTRSGSRSGSLPIFILTKRQPSRSTQPDSWSRKLLVRIGGEAAAAIDRHAVAAAAEQSRQAADRGSCALRSHSAASTAEIAQAASPERPRLRTLRCIAIQQPGMSKLSRCVDRLGEQAAGSSDATAGIRIGVAEAGLGRRLRHAPRPASSRPSEACRRLPDRRSESDRRRPAAA